MAHNLFISYDLNAPGQSYDRIIARIKALSPNWAKIHYSLFYVSADLTAQQAVDRLTPVLDRNDSLLVVDASTNSAAWYNIPLGNDEYIKLMWNR